MHSILVYFPSFAFHISVDSMLLAGTVGSSVVSQSDQLCEKKRWKEKFSFFFVCCNMSAVCSRSSYQTVTLCAMYVSMLSEKALLLMPALNTTKNKM